MKCTCLRCARVVQIGGCAGAHSLDPHGCVPVVGEPEVHWVRSGQRRQWRNSSRLPQSGTKRAALGACGRHRRHLTGWKDGRELKGDNFLVSLMTYNIGLAANPAMHLVARLVRVISVKPNRAVAHFTTRETLLPQTDVVPLIVVCGRTPGRMVVQHNTGVIQSTFVPAIGWPKWWQLCSQITYACVTSTPWGIYLKGKAHRFKSTVLHSSYWHTPTRSFDAGGRGSLDQQAVVKSSKPDEGSTVRQSFPTVHVSKLKSVRGENLAERNLWLWQKGVNATVIEDCLVISRNPQ